MTPYPQSMDVPQYMADALAFLRGDRSPELRNKLFHDSWEALGYAGGKYFPISTVLMTNPLQFTPFHFNFNDIRHVIDTLENHQRVMSSEAFDTDKLWSFLMALASKILAMILTGQK